MADRLVLVALACAVAVAGLPAQTDDPQPRVRAQLTAARDWSWQCDPIRCALLVTNAGVDALVRPKRSTARSALFPFEVERERDEGWEPVQPAEARRGWHPARYLTSPAGQRLERGDSFAFEVELWDLDAVSEPGRIRFRFALEVRDRANEGAAWAELQTPWLAIEIRGHAANAVCLLPEDAAELRTRYDLLSNALNSTRRTAMNRGPFNPGPVQFQRWRHHVPAAERLLDDEDVSEHLRSRARLALAYDAIERALRAKDGESVRPLREASKHLAAVELDAQPSSGGLEPLRRMLVACVDRRLRGKSQSRGHAELCEEYPFFGAWWSWELRQLLLD